MPQLLAFVPALDRREPIPLGPFFTDQLFRLNHEHTLPESGRRDNYVESAVLKPFPVRDPLGGNAEFVEVGFEIGADA